MKYFTKEWSELLGKTHWHEGLKEDNRAAVYSEEYFVELYNKELDKHLALQKKVFSVPIEIACPPEIRPETIAGLESHGASKRDVEKAKKEVFDTARTC